MNTFKKDSIKTAMLIIGFSVGCLLLLGLSSRQSTNQVVNDTISGSITNENNVDLTIPIIMANPANMPGMYPY